jgi:uncharacterized membrane protein YkvA (DUF1232 family)
MERTYIDFLKERLNSLKDSDEHFERELLYFPDLIKLLCEMLDDESVEREARLLINVALGYLVVPNDIIPEDVYGAYGYMDDLYISCVVISRLKNEYSDLIYKLWNGYEELDKVLDTCTFKSEKFLTERYLKEKLLRYCGLND